MCEYHGVLIVISHDRHFLNSVCTHTADIDYETIIMYPGGYDDMVLAKTQIRARMEADNAVARKEDRATERIYRALFGRNTFGAGSLPERRKSSACRPRNWRRSNIQRPYIRFATEMAVRASSAGSEAFDEVI